MLTKFPVQFTMEAEGFNKPNYPIENHEFEKLKFKIIQRTLDLIKPAGRYMCVNLRGLRIYMP